MTLLIFYSIGKTQANTFLHSRETRWMNFESTWAREAEGAQSVHLYFPSDLDAGPQITSHLAVTVYGLFQKGLASARTLDADCSRNVWPPFDASSRSKLSNHGPFGIGWFKVLPMEA